MVELFERADNYMKQRNIPEDKRHLYYNYATPAQRRRMVKKLNKFIKRTYGH